MFRTEIRNYQSTAMEVQNWQCFLEYVSWHQAEGWEGKLDDLEGVPLIPTYVCLLGGGSGLYSLEPVNWESSQWTKNLILTTDSSHNLVHQDLSS